MKRSPFYLSSRRSRKPRRLLHRMRSANSSSQSRGPARGWQLRPRAPSDLQEVRSTGRCTGSLTTNPSSLGEVGAPQQQGGGPAVQRALPAFGSPSSSEKEEVSILCWSPPPPPPTQPTAADTPRRRRARPAGCHEHTGCLLCKGEDGNKSIIRDTPKVHPPEGWKPPWLEPFLLLLHTTHS